MKYLILSVLIFFGMNLVFSNELITSTRKLTQDELPYIFESELAEIVYNRLEIKKNLPVFTSKYVDKLAKKRTDVPSAIWINIKNSIDYSSIENSIISAIDENYSSSEMQDLIDKYSDEAIIPITKLTFRNDLYVIIEEFNNSSLQPQINQILESNGYDTL